MKRNTKSEAVALYIKGLNALRACLGDAHTKYKFETICAPFLLQTCEVNRHRIANLVSIHVYSVEEEGNGWIEREAEAIARNLHTLATRSAGQIGN